MHKPHTSYATDWSQPDLAALLSNIANWHIEQRQPLLAMPIDILAGNGASSTHHATLLGEQGDNLIVSTTSKLLVGGPVRIRQALRTERFATVNKLRVASRASDLPGTFIYWLNVVRK